jgi:predicted amidophosphoribosyltransferase
MLFPPRCVICDVVGSDLCDGCAATLVEAPSVKAPSGVDSMCALCSYEGGGADLVLAIKRRNRREVIPRIGACLAEALEHQRCSEQQDADQPSPEYSRHSPGAGAPVITWLPTTPARKRERGFDQAELLARQIGRQTRWPVLRLLRREGGAQMGLTRADREVGACFTSLRRCAAEVVMVDDVLTTGATASAGAVALRSAGARTVRAAFIAITP